MPIRMNVGKGLPTYRRRRTRAQHYVDSGLSATLAKKHEDNEAQGERLDRCALAWHRAAKERYAAQQELDKLRRDEEEQWQRYLSELEALRDE